MKIKDSGFTIVELLIAITVIAILAAVTIVSWTSVRQASENDARITHGESWVSTFELYKSRFGIYPDLVGGRPDGRYCLGTGFPGGKCRDYTAGGPLEADSSVLTAQLQRVSPVLPAQEPMPEGQMVGPYVRYETSPVAQLSFGIILSGTTCPDGWSTLSTASDSIECTKAMPL